MSSATTDAAEREGDPSYGGALGRNREHAIERGLHSKGTPALCGTYISADAAEDAPEFNGESPIACGNCKRIIARRFALARGLLPMPP